MPGEARPGALARVPDLIGTGILVVAPDPAEARAARITYANDAAAALMGCTPAELLGQPPQILRGDATDPREFARLEEAIAAARPVELAVQIGDAGERAVRADLVGRPLSREDGAYLLELRDASRTRGLAEEVRELGQRLDALSSLTSDALYYLRVEPDCRLVLEWAAGAFSRLTGYGADEVGALGGWVALIEPADLRAVQRRAQRLLTGEEAGVEYRIRTRSGERRWLSDRARPHWDDAHELVVGALCVARDITEQRVVEDRLRAQEHDRRALESLTEGLVCSLDQEGRLCAVAGQAQGELAGRLRVGVGRSLGELLDPETAAIWRAQLERVVPGWAPIGFEFTVPTVRGESEAYQVRLSAGAAGLVLALIRRRPREPVAALGAAPLLRALLDLQTSAAVLLSPGLTVVELNAAAEDLTGWHREAGREQSFVELMALGNAQPMVREDLERALAGTRVSGSEAWLRLPGGQEGRIVWNYTPLLGGHGEVLAVLAQGEALAPSSETTTPPLDDEHRLKTIMDNVADGIVSLDKRGVIVSFSRSAEAIFGYERDEAIGRSAEFLVVPGPRTGGAVLERIMGAAKVPGESLEMLARRRAGEVVPIELAASEVRFNGDTLYILTIRDITIRKQTEETIRNLAYHDPLTGLPNRLLFNDRLSQAIERARRQQQLLAVIILDLDRFKLINDSLGLARGDQVLRAVGERLLGAVRKSDTVARLGGDDFLLLLPGVDSAENAAKVAQKLLDTFAQPLRVDDQELHIGASLGITLYPHDGEDAETLIRNADTALYRAKEHARGGYQFYTTDMNATAFERLVLETQLRRALERRELVVYYQPQVRLDSGSVVAVEALVRWRHRELGLVSPAEFIPLAEETGLIVELGRWVLATACAEVRRWQEAGFGDLRLSVNLSGRQFQQADLVRSIARVIEETTLDPADLELELTESSIMRDPDQAVAKLQALARLGIRLSIDDFGTGYSSLAHLKRFPIKTLKIDQSFIQDITTDPNDAAIAQAIIALAETLNLKVIAEGVETTDQLDVLRRYHCDEMQGYLFSRPLPPEQLLELLRRGERLH